MGTAAHVVVVGAPRPVLAYAIDRIEQLESRWSRFRPTSEVSLLNASAGSAVTVSEDTAQLVGRALDGWRFSDGWFDPTLLGDVVRAGYQRSFAHGLSGDGSSTLRRGAAGIVIDENRVTIPSGVGFDPGGIGKGLAADIVVGELMTRGATGACVNLGGDIAVDGVAPDDGDWTIDIDHPSFSAPVTRVALRRGGVATSTTLKRRWLGSRGDAHHLIDPSTGLPSTARVTQTTVIARDAWVAEVLAKTLLLRHDGFEALDDTAVDAMTVDADGGVTTTVGFDRFTARLVRR